MMMRTAITTHIHLIVDFVRLWKRKLMCTFTLDPYKEC
jgi:hypothetical protein